ncbi:hypothetical protein G6F42_022026 [Rhizopus arrhizus]|nr:hypothetical protein G6F42_022026 [Rhizopus arrhizus]
MSNHPAETNIVPADLVLKVDIIRGRNLNREDEVGIRQRTDTIRKSSDPEWLCSFEFNISNDIMGHRKRIQALKKHGLSITVFNKDRFSSIFLGQTSWSLEEMFSSPDQIAFDDTTAS